jgi:hypothetical protein
MTELNGRKNALERQQKTEITEKMLCLKTKQVIYLRGMDRREGGGGGGVRILSP